MWVDGQLRAVLDLAEPAILYAAEYDGAEWHSSDEQVAHDTERREELTDGDWILDPFRAEHVVGLRANADKVMRKSVERARRRLARRVHL